MRLALALVILLSACDVVVSVGDHDVGGVLDASAFDAPADAVALDAGHDADSAPDGHHEDVASSMDAGEHDAHADTGHCASSDDAGTGDAGTCRTCQVALCCDTLVACEAAPPCLCMADCLLIGNALTECMTHCSGVDHAEHDALVACSRASCAASCP